MQELSSEMGNNILQSVTLLNQKYDDSQKSIVATNVDTE